MPEACLAKTVMMVKMVHKVFKEKKAMTDLAGWMGSKETQALLDRWAPQELSAPQGPRVVRVQSGPSDRPDPKAILVNKDLSGLLARKAKLAQLAQLAHKVNKVSKASKVSRVKKVIMAKLDLLDLKVNEVFLVLMV